MSAYVIEFSDESDMTTLFKLREFPAIAISLTISMAAMKMQSPITLEKLVRHFKYNLLYNNAYIRMIYKYWLYKFIYSVHLVSLRFFSWIQVSFCLYLLRIFWRHVSRVEMPVLEGETHFWFVYEDFLTFESFLHRPRAHSFPSFSNCPVSDTKHHI